MVKREKGVSGFEKSRYVSIWERSIVKEVWVTTYYNYSADKRLMRYLKRENLKFNQGRGRSEGLRQKAKGKVLWFFGVIPRKISSFGRAGESPTSVHTP